MRSNNYIPTDHEIEMTEAEEASLELDDDEEDENK